MLSSAGDAAVRWLMLSTGLLTTEDLDQIGCSFGADLALQTAVELVAAIDRGLMADPADTGYALMLAAEITEREGELRDAELLAKRAVEAYRAHGDSDVGYARAFHASLLLQLGRDDEAMAELTALRPKLSDDPDAVSYISEAWEGGGHADIAEQWLTEALTQALEHDPDLVLRRDHSLYEMDGEIAFSLALQRHRVRRELDLPHDEHDYLADRLMNAMHVALGIDQETRAGTVLLVWPQPEFDRLLQLWPTLAEEYGQTWDDYRTTVERSLVQSSESSEPRWRLLAGAVDELAHYAELSGGDPADSQVRQGYTEHLEAHPQETAWPPDHDQNCWCGSELTYQECCLPRART